MHLDPAFPELRTKQSLRRHITETMTLAWPVILGQVGNFFIETVNTMMIGDMGSLYLSAASIANSIFMLIAVIGIGVSMAMSPLTARLIGAERGGEAMSRMLHQGLISGFWMSILLTGLLLVLAETIPLLGQQPESVPLAQSYLRILALSLPPMLLFLSWKHFLDGFEAVLPGMALTLFMVVIHLFFNWVLIHGKLGFPAMGLDGAGWSSLISRILGVLGIMVYVINSRRFGKYFKARKVFIHRKSELLAIFRIGLPSGIQYLFEVGAFSGAVLLAGRIGQEEQSAHQIAIQIAYFTYMFYLGISTAASIRVGNAVGRKDYPSLRMASIAAVGSGLGFVFLFASFILLARNHLPWLYIDEQAVCDIASRLLLIAAFFQLFDGMQSIVIGALRGVSDVRIPTAVTFIAYWVIGLPSAFLFSEVFRLGVKGIWYGLTIGLGFSAILLILRLLNRIQPKGAASGI
jgi:multidrug resistance protein, MATE family